MASQSMNPALNATLRVLSVGGIATGLLMIATPRLGADLFGVPQTPQADIISRLLGSRLLVIGEALWYARSALSESLAKGDAARITTSKRDVKRLLWVGVAIDVLDLVSTIPGILDGNLNGKGIPLMVGFPVFSGSVGLLGLRRL